MQQRQLALLLLPCSGHNPQMPTLYICIVYTLIEQYTYIYIEDLF